MYYFNLYFVYIFLHSLYFHTVYMLQLRIIIVNSVMYVFYIYISTTIMFYVVPLCIICIPIIFHFMIRTFI